MHPITFTWIEDLYWYDGPLLSLVKSGDQHYLDVWCDVREGAKAPEGFHYQIDVRYLVKISDADLQQYRQNKLTLRDVVNRAEYALGCVGSWHAPRELKAWSPAEMEALGYMPEDGSYLEGDPA